MKIFLLINVKIFSIWTMHIYRSRIFLLKTSGAPVAQWVKRWPTDLAVPGSIPACAEIFPTVNGVPFAQPFIINLSSSWYDWNTVKKDVKSQVIHPSILKTSSKHTSWIIMNQYRFNIMTSLRWINVDSMQIQRCVPSWMLKREKKIKTKK